MSFSPEHDCSFPPILPIHQRNTNNI